MKNVTASEIPSGFKFEQPFGSVVQVGYVVKDVVAAMTSYARDLHIGPWFYFDSYEFKDAKYCGESSEAVIRVGIAFAGNMSFELIEQVNDKPSIYQSRGSANISRFHHWGIGSNNFEADLANQVANGYEVRFTARSPRGIRLAYLDTLGVLPGMIEIIEFNERQENLYHAMFEAAKTWDGAQPIRSFDSLNLKY